MSASNTSVKVMNAHKNVSDLHKEIPDKGSKLNFCQLLMAEFWTMEAYADTRRTCSVHTKELNQLGRDRANCAPPSCSLILLTIGSIVLLNWSKMTPNLMINNVESHQGRALTTNTNN